MGASSSPGPLFWSLKLNVRVSLCQCRGCQCAPCSSSEHLSFLGCRCPAVCSTCVSGLRPQPQPERLIPWGTAGARGPPAALAMFPHPQYLWVFGIEFSWFYFATPPLRLGGYKKAVGWGWAGMVWGSSIFSFLCVYVYLTVLSHPYWPFFTPHICTVQAIKTLISDQGPVHISLANQSLLLYCSTSGPGTTWHLPAWF